MPNAPTLGSVHQNTALTEVAIGWKNPAFVLGGVAATVPVAKESDVYHQWNKEDFYRNEAEEVLPGDDAPRGGWKLDPAVSYQTACIKYAWPIPDRVRRNMDPAIASEVNAVRRCMDKIGLKKERTIAQALSTPGSWGSSKTLAAGTTWYRVTTSGYQGKPIEDIDALAETIQGKIGFEINTLAMNRITFRVLRRHPDILELVKYTGTAPARVTLAALAELFEVPRILVCNAIYNSAGEGLAGVYAPVMDAALWMGYVSPRPAVDEPSAAYVFEVGGPSVRTWREDSKEQDVVEAQENFVFKITAADAGAVVANTYGF
jgi:hypothetical protein